MDVETTRLAERKCGLREVTRQLKAMRTGNVFKVRLGAWLGTPPVCAMTDRTLYDMRAGLRPYAKTLSLQK